MYLGKIVFLFSLALLASCEKLTPKAPIETVESLAANPERLRELRQQCKADRAKLGDELCNRVAEATNKRFFGDGKVPYTPPKKSPKF
ncbi:EexN family lipoprotein [Delftia acidovorans]|uniref:EexN family lipoprotein n=1 Tax=Delftia acidovorans TaxID=80866 RepID=A0AAJ2R787_DELAC|nr:EexN family lipoprotein [Delftia acidovorans]MDX4956538.1 EexN family lipoprotein [Delftia acidovorans]